MNRLEYYQNIEALFEVVKCLKGRETVFRGVDSMSHPRTWRCIKAHNLDFLRKNFERWDFFKDELNIYHSLASYFNMPVFDFNLEKRKIQQEEFKNNFESFMVGYDLGIDLDAHNAEASNIIIEDMKALKSVFDDYKLPYTLKCSGSGFHFNLASNYFNKFLLKDKFDTFGNLNMILSQKLFLLSLCESNTKRADKRQIWKCPYSYDYKSGNVALPLDDNQAENFNFSMVKPENVINLGIKNRGLLERKPSQDGLRDFMIDYIGDGYAE